MANEQDRKEFEKRTSTLVQPPKPFPKVPDYMKRTPAYKEAWESWEKEVQKWIESGRGG